MSGAEGSQADPPNEGLHDHEVVRVFQSEGWPLNVTLVAMLNEHYSHRTGRKGCGFTQAGRYIAEFVNRPREPLDYDEVRLFGERCTSDLASLILQARQAGEELQWRTMDQRIPDGPFADSATRRMYDREAARLARLRAVCSKLELEESRIVASLIADCVLGGNSGFGARIPSWPEKLAIGTCPLAERYFLEVAGAFVRRSGTVNVIVDESQRPLMIEKVKLGDDHSCVSVAPLLINEVRIPPGSLLGVQYEGAPSLRPARTWPGSVIPIGACQGFRFLRLTTLAVSPANRARAFSAHFDAQVTGGLFGPHEITVEMLAAAALEQV